MASECTQETVLRFLTERGGRVKNVDLIEHFRSTIPTEPGKKAAAKEAFKRYVDTVAVVKVDNGEKYVCLKKKFRVRLGADGHEPKASEKKSHAPGAVPSEKSVNENAKQEISPGSGCEIAGLGVPESASTSAEIDSPTTCTRAKRKGSDQDVVLRKLEDIPELSVSEASPQHVTAESGGISKGRYDQTIPNIIDSRSECTVPDVVDSRSDQTVPYALVGRSKMSDKAKLEDGSDQTVPLEGTSDHTAEKGLEGTSDQSTPVEQESEADQKVYQWLRHRPSQRGDRSVDEGHRDLVSVPGGDINTPKGSRKNFLEHMMSSSPQVRRSIALRYSVYLSNRCKDSSVKNDGDAASLHSSSGTTDYENAPVALEPLEHEWMMCASTGNWESLRQLLDSEPGLVCKKDFVTGFTCLHWAAKMGKAELLALLVSYSIQHGVLVDVNSRSSAGYTPLHLAAMHNHMEVVKLLVGAYDADVEVRDYSGKKASQYLKGDVAHDVLDIVGGSTDVDSQCTEGEEGRGWRLSKVFQANLRPLKLLNHSTSEDDMTTAGESAGMAKENVLRRKTSLRSLKPRLSKTRTRTQIVHSTSLFGQFEKEPGESTGLFKSRPKSNLFG
ncbi:ankyrin repeat domain-containing protein SOWAHC-like [Hoplias malabaricus]|uniref:ankyrin repeat domain-containing protein SOWAHC-like n=1 Tax=Hoplias malabaricus TaxID=27720 RepID=UPI003461EF40